MINKQGKELFIALKRYEDFPMIDETIEIIEPTAIGHSFMETVLSSNEFRFYRFELGEEVTIERERKVNVVTKQDEQAV